MQDSSNRGVIIMNSRNISGRIFKLAHLILCLVIIWGVQDSTWVPPSTFFAKVISSIINYFSLRLYIFRSLLPPESRRFKSSSWSFFVYGACDCLLLKGEIILEVPFIVASETSNSSQVLRFSILRSAVSTRITLFMWFQQLVHGHIEAIQLTLRV